jgi:vancomycin resistance protein YoaR
MLSASVLSIPKCPPSPLESERFSVTEPSDSTISTERIDYAARRESRRDVSTGTSRSMRPIVIVVIAAVVVLLILAEASLSYARIHPGVTISGVDVGGMVPEKARLALEAGLAKGTSQPITVSHATKTWSLTSEQVGLAFDYDVLIARAMSVGRAGGVFPAIGARLSSWVSGTDINATSAARATLVATSLDTISKGTDVSPVDSAVEIVGTEPRVVSGENGVKLDRPEATRRITAAFLESARTVKAPVIADVVEVDDAEAQAAADVAKRLLSAPATVTLAEKEWTFKPDQIARWIEFVQAPASESSASVSSSDSGLLLQAVISSEKAADSVTEALGTKVGRPAVNARFKTSNGSVTIVPSKDGTGPDLDALAAELTSVLSDSTSKRTVELRTTVTKPKVSTADARAMGIKRRISLYTTTYSSSNLPRVNNIHTLGDALDGTLVAPGKSFSFNGSIGERTADKGYQEANAIVNGKLVPQLGGGICQVGTTIFNAVFESGLPVIQRRNHSFYISHYPKGRDATVSWGGPDFKFKNDTDNWVLISVSYSSTSLTIALYGTDPGYDVEASTSEWRSIKPFSEDIIKDKTMAKGSKIIEDPGVDGKSITVTRTVTKDGKVVRTDNFVSVYKPKSQTVRVGTKTQVPAEESAIN